MLNTDSSAKQPDSVIVMHERHRYFAGTIPRHAPSTSTLSTIPTLLSSPVVAPAGDVDTDTAALSSTQRSLPCFWALLSNCDLRFVYVSQSAQSGHDQAPSASQMAIDTGDDLSMPDASARPMADGPSSGGSHLHIDTHQHRTHVAGNAHNRSDAPPAANQVCQCLVGTSLFEHIHSEEVAAARADLGHFVAQKTLYGSITRCRFRVPKSARTGHRAATTTAPGPLHERHLTPLSTPTAAQSTGYFDTTFVSGTWSGQHEKTTTPPLPSLIAGARPIGHQHHHHQQQQQHAAKDGDQAYAVVDITMNVICDTLVLAFFHVVDESNGRHCCDTLFTSKDAELLHQQLNGLSPPITPVEARITPSTLCAAPISTRVLQILSATTGQVLFLYPPDNLHRLAAGTELPPANVNDWCSRLFYPSDYRNLHDKTMAAAQDTLGTGHLACRHVCSRLRFDTVHGTRVAECVATRWASLIFICTQLIGSEAEIASRDDVGGALGETRFVTPVGPFDARSSAHPAKEHAPSPAEERLPPLRSSSAEGGVITRCQSVPDFMAHRTDNPATRPSLARLATTTAATFWPAAASPAGPLTPSHVCTAPPAHASGAAVSSSLEQQQSQPSYAPTSYGQSPGARPSSYYHQHSVEPSDPMQWSDDTRTMPTTPLFAQKPSHAGHIHAPHTSPFPLAVRQRDFPNHHGGSNNGSSSGGGGGGGGGNNVEGK
ncbi:hypothetical protein SYNPS1DRAFT_27864, partial [Syncephalis pseudoplumigaleata]